MSDDGVVFERPAPAALVWEQRAAVGGAAVLAGVFGCPLLGMLLGPPVSAPAGGVEGTVQALVQLTGRLPAVLSLVALLLSPALLALVFAADRRRRFGSCRITEDVVTFTAPDALPVRIPVSEVLDRVETAHGVLIRLADRPPWLDLLRPLLIPAPSAAERRVVLDLLEPAGRLPALRFGSSRWLAVVVPWAYLGASVLLAATGLFAWTVVGEGVAAGLGVLTVPCLLPPALWVYADAIEARIVAVQVGRAGLLLGRHRLVPWRDVRSVAVGEGVLLVREGAEQVRLILGAEAAAAAAAIEQRARAAGRHLSIRPLPEDEVREGADAVSRALLALTLAIGVTVALPLTIKALE